MAEEAGWLSATRGAWASPAAVLVLRAAPLVWVQSGGQWALECAAAVCLPGRPCCPPVVTWMVRNAGQNTANGTWVDRVSLSVDAVPGGDRTLGELTRNGPMAPGEVYSAQLQVVVPADVTGEFYLLVTTDATDVVEELENENNNTGATASTLRVTAPDLRPINIVAPPTGLTDEPVLITYRVRNAGDGAATGAWIDRVYVSVDQTWDANDPQVGGDQNVSGPLEAGSEYSRQVTFNAPHAPGTYWVIVKIDATNQVTEPATGGENSNTLVVRFHPFAMLAAGSGGSWPVWR